MHVKSRLPRRSGHAYSFLKEQTIKSSDQQPTHLSKPELNNTRDAATPDAA